MAPSRHSEGLFGTRPRREIQSLPFRAALLFALWGGSVALAGVIEQGAGERFIAFQGENYDAILNPDVANDVQNGVQQGYSEDPAQIWTTVSSVGAIGGAALEAPPSPHKQVSDPGLQESVAAYQLRFLQAGTYHFYIRGRNNGVPGNAGTDSIWIPAGFGAAAPSVARGLPNSGNYEWKTDTATTYTVSSSDVGQALEFRIGVRESDARVDAIVLSLDSNLTAQSLDALFSPPPGNAFPVADLAELHAALAVAEPGTSIVMQDGEWRDADIVFDGKNSRNGSGGTAEQPITLRAQTSGRVVLTGDSTLRIAGSYMVVDGLKFTNGYPSGGDIVQFRNGSGNLADHCRLTNSAIINYNPPDPATEYKWVSVYGLYNRVDACWFSGMNHKGVTLTVWPGTGAPANYTQIDRNYFGNRAEGWENGFETIRIGTSDVSQQESNAAVEYNYFYHCDGEIETISNKSVGNVYRGKTFVDCKGQLTLRHGAACRVEGNFFFGANASNAGGVRIIGPDHVVVNNYFQDLKGNGSRAAIAMMNGVPDSPLERYLRVERALVAFNTFISCKDNFAVGVESGEGDTTLPPQDCAIANNVVWGAEAPLIEYINTPTSFTYEGNIMYGAALGIPNPGGITIADPKLALAEDGLYRPAPDSPAIGGAAGSYPTVTADMDGQARDDGFKDAGADEVSTATLANRPLTPEDVGPLWMKPARVPGLNWLRYQ